MLDDGVIRCDEYGATWVYDPKAHLDYRFTGYTNDELEDIPEPLFKVL